MLRRGVASPSPVDAFRPKVVDAWRATGSPKPPPKQPAEANCNGTLHSGHRPIVGKMSPRNSRNIAVVSSVSTHNMDQATGNR